MYTMILYIISLSNPEALPVEVNLNTEAPTYHQCINDMPSMVKYVREHPNHWVVRWTCKDKRKISL